MVSSLFEASFFDGSIAGVSLSCKDNDAAELVFASYLDDRAQALLVVV